MIDPAKLDQTRLLDLASAKKNINKANEKAVNATVINDATPEDQKPKGSAKLPSLLFALGSQIPQIIQPSLQNLIATYIPNPNICPDKATLDKLIFERNNIVNSLNNIGVKVEQTGASVSGVSNFLTVAIGLIGTIDLTAIAVSTALKVPPVSTLPIPGAIPSLLNDAQTFIRKTTFDKYGNSKLSKLQGVLSSSSLVISIIGTYILTAKQTISLIDDYIKKCNQYADLLDTSKEINDIADAQLQAEQTQNQTTYNGFIIEIEEIPYTPTVKRRRAVGKNQSGITLIQTELSFTTNDNTLINELKAIIDKDNLKAY
jgi:hypothetical protein